MVGLAAVVSAFFGVSDKLMNLPFLPCLIQALSRYSTPLAVALPV